MNELTTVRPAANVEAYRASTEAADICKEIVVATSSNIQGRRFVSVEGWQAIAVAHGCALSARDVEKVDGGIRAIGEVRRMSDGQLIATGEGFVGEDETTWFGGKDKKGKEHPRRHDYAIRAMAQTRAMSRAGRTAFAHVVVMMKAGLATTPAEEMTYDLQTGEVIEGALTREKVQGIHKIKERLRTLMTDGAAATSLDDFNALVSQHKTDLETIKEAQHEWWTGDGDDFEGFRSFIKRRREELDTPELSEDFRMCLETLEACTSTQELDAWFKANGSYVETLDGEESRRIQQRFDELEAGLKAAAVVRA